MPIHQKLIERRNYLRGLITMCRNIGTSCAHHIEELVAIEQQLECEFGTEACLPVFLTGRETMVLLAHLEAAGVCDNALISKLRGAS